jgi:3-oxosteroid 1-dehydrogenase
MPGEKLMAEPETHFDFIVVGSGGGSTPAALAMHEAGKRVLIIEKSELIGGTSAYSGGVIWIPNNHILNDAGGGDSHAKSREYIDGIVGPPMPSSTPEKRDAWIRYGAQMIEFLEAQGMEFRHAHWPDYYEDRPGGIADGRSLAAPLFDVNKLGEWGPKLAHNPMTSAMPIPSWESVGLFNVKSTWRGKWIAAKMAMRLIFLNKLLGKTIRGAGNALQGRLFQIVLRKKIPIWTATPVTDLLVEDGKVVGVLAERDGRPVQVRASLGVLLNAGGFSRNLEMREKYQPKPTSIHWTQVNPCDTGDMHRAAMKLGAATDLLDESFWLPSSFMPDGTFVSFHTPNDTGRPHCITVGPDGKRFVNEANPYMEFGKRMYEAGAVPAWAIIDSRGRKNSIWGTMLPGRTPQKLIDSGYIRKFDTLDDLARSCGIDPQGLAATVERFNRFARSGVDEDFGRGGNAYNHYYGDPSNKPNPNLGTIEKPPFYAVAIYPGDVGTCGGLVTDEHARVLHEDGQPIPGLYATGNTAAAVGGRVYAGAGASVGPSMTFGYIAALHASRSNI